METLTGRVALVTGAAQGVGFGLARAFAEEGMRIVLSDINAATLDAAVASITESGTEAIGVVADASDQEAVGRMRDAAYDAFGTVHVLCNNVAAGGRDSLIEPIDVAGWEHVFSVSLFSVLHGLNAFLPRMLEQGEGHVVNTASRQGLVASPLLGAYPPAKAALITLSEMLHAELADACAPVGVTVLTPGGVRSESIVAELARQESGEEGTDPEMLEFLRTRVAAAVEPIELGRLTVRAITTGALYVNTHAETLEWLGDRVGRIVADSQQLGTPR
jgi:NAD(P)-dependent dehydrogenase (short-subunit alcohol dehydrogenase family)